MSFKHDQDNLFVYERKYLHSFTVKLDNKNYEGSVVKTLKKGYFLLGHDKLVQLYNRKKEAICTIEIDEVEDEEVIISMDLTRDDKRLGVALGKVLQGADETITKFIVFEIKKKKSDDG